MQTDEEKRGNPWPFSHGFGITCPTCGGDNGTLADVHNCGILVGRVASCSCGYQETWSLGHYQDKWGDTKYGWHRRTG